MGTSQIQTYSQCVLGNDTYFSCHARNSSLWNITDLGHCRVDFFYYMMMLVELVKHSRCSVSYTFCVLLMLNTKCPHVLKQKTRPKAALKTGSNAREKYRKNDFWRLTLCSALKCFRMNHLHHSIFNNKNCQKRKELPFHEKIEKGKKLAIIFSRLFTK